jgi:hypothetical protein
MARNMKTTAPPRCRDNTLVIVVDALRIAGGPRQMPRGGKHGCGKHPGRARANRQWRRLLA